MANLIAVVGRTGTGKTTSLFHRENTEKGVLNIGINHEETIIFNVSGKPLPVKGAKKLFPIGSKITDGSKDIHSSSPKKIQNMIQAVDANEGGKFSKIKNLIVDDAQYLQGFTFMDRIREEGWEKFNITGEAGYLPLKAALECTRQDLNLIFTYHPETDEGETKIKTAGKLVDAYLTIEGLFTVVLYTKAEYDVLTKKTNYFFITQTDGKNTAKTPFGMFDSNQIPNDMGLVLKKVKEYYE